MMMMMMMMSSLYGSVARIFQRGGGVGGGGFTEGHHPGIVDYVWFIPLLSIVYQRAQSYYRSMKAHIS